MESYYFFLRTKNGTELSNARNSVMLRGLTDLDVAQIAEPYRPTIDGVEWTDQPIELFKAGKWQKEKPLIIGTNFEEMSYVSAVLKEALPGGFSKRLFEVCTIKYSCENYHLKSLKRFLRSNHKIKEKS